MHDPIRLRAHLMAALRESHALDLAGNSVLAAWRLRDAYWLAARLAGEA